MTAIASTRSRSTRTRTAAATASSSSGVTIEPSAAIRSGTPIRRRFGARNTGVSTGAIRSYMRERFCRPISITSSNPAVARMPTGAPVRASTALVATVVPCTKRVTSPGSAFASPSASRMPRCTVSAAAWREEGSFVAWSRAPSHATTSVKVPPISIAIAMGRLAEQVTLALRPRCAAGEPPPPAASDCGNWLRARQAPGLGDAAPPRRRLPGRGAARHRGSRRARRPRRRSARARPTAGSAESSTTIARSVRRDRDCPRRGRAARGMPASASCSRAPSRERCPVEHRLVQAAQFGGRRIVHRGGRKSRRLGFEQ